MTTLATGRRASAIRKAHKSALVCKPTSAVKAKAVVAKAQHDHVAKVGGVHKTREQAAKAKAHAKASKTASAHAKATAKAHANASVKAKTKARDKAKRC